MLPRFALLRRIAEVILSMYPIAGGHSFLFSRPTFQHSFSFLGLEAYCLIEILRPTGSLDIHQGTCAPSLRSLFPLSSSLFSLLLSSYLCRIGRIENPSCSTCGHPSQDTLIFFCTVQSRTLWTARSFAILCLSTISGPVPRELPGFWGSMVFRHVHIPRKGLGSNNNTHLSISACVTSKCCCRPTAAAAARPGICDHDGTSIELCKKSTSYLATASHHNRDVTHLR